MDASGIRYVFLDRDGVINRKLPEGAYVTEWSQFSWLPGAVEAVAKLQQAGLQAFVITNQRGIALGLYTAAALEMIHDRMRIYLAERGGGLAGIYYCPHDVGECLCRKPEVGLFEQAFVEFPAANPQNSIMIGDSLSDIQAGRRLGMRTIFIKGKAEQQKAGAVQAAALADVVAGSLLEAVEFLIFRIGVACGSD